MRAAKLRAFVVTCETSTLRTQGYRFAKSVTPRIGTGMLAIRRASDTWS